MVVRSRHWMPQDGDIIRNYRTTESQKAIEKWKYKYATDVGAEQHRDSGGLGKHIPMAEITGPISDANIPTVPWNDQLLELTVSETNVPISVYNPRWMAEMLPVVGSQRIYPRHHRIHGDVVLPEGYRLVYVPSDAELVSCAQDNRSDINPSKHYGTMTTISSSYSLPKAVIAIFQTIYAAFTQYQSLGNQIQVFGYAAFGLTVTPYIVMSIINFLAAIATPEYNALFLIRSEIMDEAEKRGGIFEGVVGSLIHDQPLEPDPRCPPPGIVRQTKAEGPIYLVRHNLGKVTLKPNLSDQALSDTILSIVPFKPKSPKDKDEAKAYKSWLYIPSTTPFRRSRTITECTLHPPANSLLYQSVNQAADKADFGYKAADLKDRRHTAFSGFLVPLLISMISILIIGILSHFSPGQSTVAQRGWTMAWLATGIAIAPLSPGLGSPFTDGLMNFWEKWRERGDHIILMLWKSMLNVVGILLFTGVFFAPALGGLVIVGQEIKAYGSCMRIN